MQSGHPRILPGVLAGALLAALTLAAFWPVTRCEFIQYDDPAYVTDNSAVVQGLGWRSVAWAFQINGQANWHPLTWLSHMLDVQLFGLDNPAAHHLVNVGFHIANALLLFGLLRRLTGAFWRCLWVAALFALHPLHVESVAWVAERKDVLSTCFGLLALLAWAGYAERSQVPSLKSQVTVTGAALPAGRFYGLSLLLFACSLMSKPTLVTFPCLLLLLDFWPLHRLQIENQKSKIKSLLPLLREKLPFFGLAAASCVVTLIAQAGADAVQTFDSLSLGARLANALLGYAAYLQKAFWPAALAVFYPLASVRRPEWHLVAAVLLLAALTAGALLARRRRYWLVGWLWFLGLLVPMIGLVQVGEQAIADRYTYLPLVGLFLALAWGVAELAPPGPVSRAVLAAGMLATVGACATLTWRQAGHWRDTETLMRHALAVTTNNYVAYDNLGNHYWQHGRAADALACASNSLAIAFRPQPLNNIGLILASRGQHTNALPLYQHILRFNRPQDNFVRLNLADSLEALGRFDECFAEYEAVLRHQPNSAQIHHVYAGLLAKQGRLERALEHYQAALRLDPDYPGARNHLAIALIQQGKLDDAIAQLQLVLRDHPKDLPTRNSLAIALTQQGKLDAAIAQLHHALRLDTNYASAYPNLGNALARQGNMAQATAAFRQYARLKPDDPRAHYDLGRALLEQDQLDEALPELRRAANAQTNNPEPHHFYGLALARNGQLPEALLQLTTAQRLQPDNPELHYHLGFACQQSGRPAEARAHYQQALRLQPDYPEARAQLQSLATNAPAPSP